MVAGCYTGQRPRFSAAKALQVWEALEFFEVPQSLRPQGHVTKMYIEAKHRELRQTAQRLMDDVSPSLPACMLPDATGTATATAYLCRSEAGRLCLKCETQLGMDVHNQWEDFPLMGGVCADPWLCEMLRHVAEGHGFKAHISTEAGVGTQLQLQMDVEGTKVEEV